MKRKLTEAEMSEAINPSLSEVFVEVAGEKVQIKIMYLRMEQKFVKLLVQHLKQQDLNAVKVVDLIADLPANALAEIAGVICANSGVDLSPEDILSKSRIQEIAQLIFAQIQKNGYLDFLAQMAGILKAGKVPSPL